MRGAMGAEGVSGRTATGGGAAGGGGAVCVTAGSGVDTTGGGVAGVGVGVAEATASDGKTTGSGGSPLFQKMNATTAHKAARATSLEPADRTRD